MPVEQSLYNVRVKMIEIEDLHKSFAGVEVIKGITVEIDKGEIVALIGAHCLGRVHKDRSGFATRPWAHSPTMFSNAFFLNNSI